MDEIRFEYQGKVLEGLVVKDGAEMTIKLNTGYNIILPKNELSKVKRTQQNEKKTGAKPAVKPAADLPKIKILHTGGTIASKVDYETGAVIAKFTDSDILNLFPELNSVANVSSELVGNIQSEMMRFAHWNILARAVEKAVKEGIDGVIITHGTDVIHMSAAALSFALENCPIPVLLVGSQRSSDRPSSDAASNLLCAATFITKTKFQGVALCMHETIDADTCAVLPGTRCRKMHTSRRDAFRPINDSPYARISYPELAVKKLRNYPKANGAFVVRPFDEKLRVGIITVHPQMYADELSAYGAFDGLVISLTGLGHAPTMVTDKDNKENEKICAALQELCKKMPVAGAPQTIYGRIDMNVYSPGRQLIDMGVLGQGLDMTVETAFVKLSWLLSNEPTKVRELYGRSLRGEISERIEKNQFD